MNKNIIILILIIALLTACGQKQEVNNEQIDNYKITLQTFYDNVQVTSNSMNSIDTTSPEYKNQMLSYLDDMYSHFNVLKETTIPEEYSSISPYITNGYSYMNQAVLLFHEAYEMEYPDASLLENAKAGYDEAFGCINSLGEALKNIENNAKSE